MIEALIEFLIAFFEFIVFGSPARPIRWIGLIIIKIYEGNPGSIKAIEKDFEYSPTPYFLGLLSLLIIGVFLFLATAHYMEFYSN